MNNCIDNLKEYLKQEKSYQESLGNFDLDAVNNGHYKDVSNLLSDFEQNTYRCNTLIKNINDIFDIANNNIENINSDELVNALKKISGIAKLTNLSDDSKIIGVKIRRTTDSLFKEQGIRSHFTKKGKFWNNIGGAKTSVRPIICDLLRNNQFEEIKNLEFVTYCENGNIKIQNMVDYAILTCEQYIESWKHIATVDRINEYKNKLNTLKNLK